MANISTMAVKICNFHKFSHCKYGRFCNFKHIDEKCRRASCDAKKCDLRHPKDCLNILQGKVCKFGDFCSFEHGISQQPSDILVNESEKIKNLEKQIEEKNIEIRQLETRVLHLETKEMFENSDRELDSDSSADEDSVTRTNDELKYFCESCNFTTIHEAGLKIHKSKKHAHDCEYCGGKFKNKDAFERHLMMEKYLSNINSREAEFDLEVGQYSPGETCLGIFSKQDPRDDYLPVVNLHVVECWNRSGHVCPLLPKDKEPHDVDPNQPIEDAVVLDYDLYDPTLHILLDLVVVGDITKPGCDLEWNIIEKIIRAN